jgi:hypothetical protein
MNALTPLFVLVPIIVGILQLVKILTDYWTRKRLIEKGLTDSVSPIKLETETMPSLHKEYSNLKWGLIAFFGGLGFIIIGFIDEIGKVELNYNSPLTVGVFFLSIATGFIVYYMMISRKLKQ